MKKSPLSTPRGGRGYHLGSNQNKGYGYYQRRNDGDNFHQMSGLNNSFGVEGDLLPLHSSSPIKSHQRNNRQYHNNLHNQHFSNRESGYSNQRKNFSNHFGSPYQRTKSPRNKQTNNPYWYRNLGITEFMDMKSVFVNPWEQLDNNRSSKHEQSSVEIVYDKQTQESSLESTSDDNTVNISSSYEETKESSSVDLHLDKINFSKSIENTTTLSDSAQIQEEQLSNKSADLLESQSSIS